MSEQAFSRFSLARELRAGDFLSHPTLTSPIEQLRLARQALAIARNGFTGANPLEIFHAKRRPHYRAKQLADQLVVRKLTRNLRRAANRRAPSRDQVVQNLCSLLVEGTPYLVLRIDIKSFFESIDSRFLTEKIQSLVALSQHSRELVEQLLIHFRSIGGSGIPRGMALSAPLAELVMRDFDNDMAHISGVYFYARYVDDIVIVASNLIAPASLVATAKSLLPFGLRFNSAKSGVSVIGTVVDPQSSSPGPITPLCDFSFLGYRFVVWEPNKTFSRSGDHSRRLELEMARSKERRIKTRIARAFLQFSADKNFDDLLDRIRFLTCNFCIRDFRTNKSKHAGIFFGYPQLIGKTSRSLAELNSFLRGVVLGKTSRLSRVIAGSLDQKQRRRLLGMCFVRGHTKRIFLRFSTVRISEIQRCWINA